MRDADVLKRMFLLLENHAKPTGDPDCPEEVQTAKRIQRDIDLSASVLSLDDDFEEVSGGFLSYTAKKRSIDKFIDGAADADAKTSSDIMTLFLLMDELAAKREESRIERQEKYEKCGRRAAKKCIFSLV
ncbi:hypothetical protein H257_06733 [Aphanomyces astaci]|uniref:DUF6818 domain-containing protein n=1 Tax=Aphanomyces astaci TaxID=112090 RepID=W4GLB4_APHAT|nr:hypothetical protein H257_06733 [Aphanomyces astaci]ETV80462.1 hypothetical protein H257_06733 [Aphanomyces astaci]RQM30638.1 hypothetical protein B5M09_013018 [Aphanomyces astaci]|eukprot:XP_009830386.1 hypothetical protein H257_06733 [Aphanomyces astaci]